MRLKSAFSYYGGKSRIIHLYPEPKHDLIIEPFAGAAAYSLLHGEGREVWINDVDPKVFAMWLFLRDELPQWLDCVPDRVAAGDKASELVPGAPEGLVSILQAEANQGTQGARGVHDQVTKFGEISWVRLKRKLQWAHERSQGWTITNLSYQDVSGHLAATWFIDPPYDNPAGRRYRQQVPDYRALASWCLSRRGQVIVCENVGADWLPFEPVVARRGIRSRYQKSNAQEAVYTFER